MAERDWYLDPPKDKKEFAQFLEEGGLPAFEDPSTRLGNPEEQLAQLMFRRIARLSNDVVASSVDWNLLAMWMKKRGLLADEWTIRTVYLQETFAMKDLDDTDS